MPKKAKKIKKGFYTWPLPPEEWDFRAVDSDDIRTAIHYEYACSCVWVRALWLAWISSPFPRWTVIELADDHYEISWSQSKATTVAMILTKYFRNGIPRPGDKNSNAVSSKLVETMPVQLRDYEFDGILFSAPNFPTPWLDLDENTRQRLQQWVRTPVAGNKPFVAFDNNVEAAACRKTQPEDYFEGAIDWTAREDDIAKTFTEWLSPMYAARGKKPTGRQGMASSDKYERLRWLTAWRLDQAGLTYRDAQHLLQIRRQAVPTKDPKHDLPFCGSQIVWCNMIAKAERQLHKRFPLRPVWDAFPVHRISSKK